MKVWITKYALTMGIFEMKAEISKGGSGVRYASGKTAKGYPVFTREFAETRDEALKVAEGMRKRRIESLKKSIAKLEKMEF